MTIQENLHSVLENIRNAEKKSGRAEGSVKLLAVSKFHPASAVLDALSCGQKLFGENRVQEAAEKFDEVRTAHPEAVLHIIGQLQSNKVKKAVGIADCIESVDRIELIQEIEKQCAAAGKIIRILLEVHTAEDSKSGFADYSALEQAVEFVCAGNTPHVTLDGFMTMAPFTDDERLIRKSFSTVREYAEKIRGAYPDCRLPVLSMGMSGDYTIAIEEGSTEVRVGTAIFGERNY